MASNVVRTTENGSEGALVTTIATRSPVGMLRAGFEIRAREKSSTKYPGITVVQKRIAQFVTYLNKSTLCSGRNHQDQKVMRLSNQHPQSAANTACCLSDNKGTRKGGASRCSPVSALTWHCASISSRERRVAGGSERELTIWVLMPPCALPSRLEFQNFPVRQKQATAQVAHHS